jgi:zinc transport system ATP-binding protein
MTVSSPSTSTNPTSALLSVSQLATGTHDGRVLAKDLHFKVMPGEALLLTGANGTGKSTLLRVLIGNTRPMKGTVSRSVGFERIGFLPQLQNTDFHLPLTLRDLLENAVHRSLDDAEILHWGLLTKDQLHLSWKTSSGGERKRALLTRILLLDPNLLLLDEPMNHLDTQSRLLVEQALIKFLQTPSEKGRALILVSHEKSLSLLPGLPALKRLHLGTLTDVAKPVGSEELEEEADNDTEPSSN